MQNIANRVHQPPGSRAHQHKISEFLHGIVSRSPHSGVSWGADDGGEAVESRTFSRGIRIEIINPSGNLPCLCRGDEIEGPTDLWLAAMLVSTQTGISWSKGISIGCYARAQAKQRRSDWGWAGGVEVNGRTPPPFVHLPLRNNNPNWESSTSSQIT